MKNIHPALRRIGFCCLCLLPFFLQAQSFTDLPGPMGTTRSILRGNNGEWFIGSNSKGVFRSVDNGQTWSGLGGNTIMAGRINDMVYDSSGKIMVCTEQGGIKTWNGTAWVNLNAGLFSACGISIPIRALAVDPTGQAYAGAHAFSACFPTGDLYRFDGAAWTSIAAGMGNTNVNALAIHPVSGELFAATDGGVFSYNGSNWTAWNAGLTSLVVHTIHFAATGDLFAGTDAGLAKWPAAGNTWMYLNNGLNGDPVHALAVNQNPNHLLAGTGYSLEQAGSLYGQLFESQNGGLNWTQVSPGLQTSVINDLAFMDNQHALAAGWGILRSNDSGQNWAPANTGFSAKTFNTQGRLAVSSAPIRALFYGSDDGVFRSFDEGLTWTMADVGLTRHIVTLLKADHFGNLFCSVMRYLGENSVGFGDGVLYKSTDNGYTWQPVQISKDWRYMEMSELPNGDLVCAHGFGAQPPSTSIVGSSFARSTDHGSSWTDLPVMSGMAFCCAANAAGDLFVAGESQSVYRSTDGGNSFELLVAPGQEGNVGTLECSPTGDLIMGSGGQRTLYFSADNGASFQTFNSPVLPDYRGASDVTFDHLGKAYCSTSGQSGMPSLFTITPPFSPDAVLTPVAGVGGSLFKMTWDDCGYLYIYRGGGILKSSTPLRLPESSCISAVHGPTTVTTLLHCSPNPTSDVLQLHSESADLMQVSLWQVNGQKLRESSLSGDLDWDISALPPGLYWLQATQPKGHVQVQKIMKL